MDYSPAKTSAWFGGWGPSFDIRSHTRLVSLCQAGGPTLMGKGHPSGCPLILVGRLFPSSTGAYPGCMTSLWVSPYFNLTPFINFNQSLTGGGSIICA